MIPVHRIADPFVKPEGFFFAARSGFLFIAITGIMLNACREQPPPVNRKRGAEDKIKVKTVNTAHDIVSIAAVGDIMLGSSYPDSTKLPPDSARNSFKTVLADLRSADITFGNLEGTLLDTGGPDLHKKKMDSAYLFRMPTDYGKVLRDAGFNLLSVANNHITDFGWAGCISTERTLDSNAIHYAGLVNKPSTIFKLNNITYGFCAFAPNAYTLSMLDISNVKSRISRLKQECDIVIVSFHGGAEGSAYEHVPFKMELYKGGNRGNVQLFAHSAIDAGADVVLGNGPHVCRALENYKGRLIAFSLGNFCTYKSVSVIGVCGYAPLLKVYLDKKGRFLKGSIIAFRQSHEKGLVHDSLNKVIARIRLLTRADFPEPGLTIADDGKITPGS